MSKALCVYRWVFSVLFIFLYCRDGRRGVWNVFIFLRCTVWSGSECVGTWLNRSGFGLEWLATVNWWRVWTVSGANTGPRGERGFPSRFCCCQQWRATFHNERETSLRTRSCIYCLSFFFGQQWKRNRAFCGLDTEKPNNVNVRLSHTDSCN